MARLRAIEIEVHNLYVAHASLNWELEAIKPKGRDRARAFAQFEAEERANCVAQIDRHKRNVSQAADEAVERIFQERWEEVRGFVEQEGQ